ncbi:hypothetical protein SLEP1_g26582 [Rubroshorea leprosula]|uniref:Uncharacterized protein n=1 Tax=Rubroshorea leprosula TaxID=152421 RepID=A0AAV5JMI7_9ROSI|nr:hypothetical protein SLEP1_g26582 [Rubroshorea leprosula]
MEATTKTATTTTTTAKPKMRRNGSRSFCRSKSFSLCFKPVVTDGGSVATTEPAFTHDPVEPLPPKVVSFDIKEEKNKGTRRRLSRVIKAVLFETSLVAKAIKKKLGQRSTDSHHLHPKPEKNPNEFSERDESLEDEEMGTASTVSSSLRFPSSITSAFLSPYSSCLSDRSVVSANGVVARENGKGYLGPNAGLSLLLMSLLIMIFWGKVCAIFCTSTWLFLMPRWSIKPSRSEKMVELPVPEIDSDLYRKKVIMRGLLERNRSH